MHVRFQTRFHADSHYKMFRLYQALFLVFCACTSALTPAQWRSQSIYQVITDRFARTDGSTSASCDLNRYCGGTWQGLIKKLDYIQNMGFSAVSHSRIQEKDSS
jgi:alpha-amylase